MNRTERLLDLITYLLNAREPVSWQEIKNHFPQDYAQGIEESNQRKFERDKAELISLGIPIDYQSGSEIKKEGYIIRKEKLFLPEIEFTPDELSLLMLAAGAVLENENFPYRDQLESAVNKITSVHSYPNSPPSEIAISYSERERTADGRDWINDLQEALDRRKTVQITYHAFSTGETTRRQVDPFGLIYRKGKWILVGWDHLRKDLRSFVVNRISRLTVNPKKPGTTDYEIPATFSLKQYQNQQPWELELEEPVQVTIRVVAHRLFELMPQLARARKVGADSFQLTVTNPSGLVSWVLSQKTDVQVISPPRVQEQIREVVQRLI